MKYAVFTVVVALALGLPALTRGSDILYVNQNDDAGAPLLWEAAFQDLGIQGSVDRIDLNGVPLDSLVTIGPTLAETYRVILWDCGNAGAIYDGTGSFLYQNDWGILHGFLLARADSGSGGVFICGDDFADAAIQSAEYFAVAFRSTWIAFNLTSGNHVAALGIVDPVVRGRSGGYFDGLSFVATGLVIPYVARDFDVLEPAGPSTMEASYGPASSSNGAIVAQTTWDVKVIISGFSLAHLDEQYAFIGEPSPSSSSGQAAIALCLGGVLNGIGYPVSPTGVRTSRRDSLAQNYPNPFNPQTVIAYSIQGPGRVTLRVYSVVGELVRTLVDGARAAGPNQETWDGRDERGRPVPSGVYFVTMSTPGFEATRKMVLLK